MISKIPHPFVLKQGRLNRAALALAASLACGGPLVGADPPIIAIDASGRLVYEHDEFGNRVPDFSHCGFAGAEREIPDVPIRAVLKPAAGDDGARIQAAIDRLSQMPADENGFRGAILLAPGKFDVAGQLRVKVSGIVFRGSGAGKNGSTLVATGSERRALIRIEGTADRQRRGTEQHHVIDDYIPVGAQALRLNSTVGLKVGDQVLVTRPSTVEWIQALGADAFGVAWKPSTRDIRWDRVITRIEGNTITLDAPITTAIEKRYGGAMVEVYDWPGRISNVGIEDMRLKSAYAADQQNDEEHAWFGVTMNDVDNAWVRRVEFRHFAGGAVALLENTKHITVEDCIALELISELGGYRRHTFFTQGQLTLFLRCWSAHGRHGFAVGHCTAGPNAFVNCHAAEAHASSGPLESWASGVLYDNVRIDGASLELENRWVTSPGTGWSAANCVLWQCQAATIRVFRPPSANNWAIGVWGEFAGDGAFAARNDFVNPISLYQAQLRERRGDRMAASISPGLVDPISSTNPTLDEAAAFASKSRQPPRQLIDIIRERFETVSHDAGTELADTSLPPTPLPAKGDAEPEGNRSRFQARLAVRNGWLVVDDRLKTGGIYQQGFWRGTTRPDEAPKFGPAITRFVPGRNGPGYTDDLVQLADRMVASDVAVFDHHYGLWYDRRRDDHTMVRRQDGNVAPPFYEQPFARSGRGKAWDGLSKYDLTRFNAWYWKRLRDFARLCDERGLILFHQNYFQHNILEAGAHWSDCPWRPANNVNDTGLPEPPPYIGDKRIFMASLFYDVANARLRELHRGYIRQCLDSFADSSNVIQATSAEYSGPLEFTRFWLDTIIDWQREHDRDALVALSAPKSVQDAILSDPKRAPHVDVIDIRYWAYTAGGELYAPAGGKNLAPRQHLRQTKQKPGGFSAIARAVREYRTRYPDKAVTYYADMHCPSGRDGWAVLIGGGSLPNVSLPEKLAYTIPTMAPADDVVIGGRASCLGNEQGDGLLYTEYLGEVLQLNLPAKVTNYHGHWIDPKTNKISPANLTSAGQQLRVQAKANVLWLERMEAD